MSFVAVSERGCAGSEWCANPEQYEAILHAFESGVGLMTFITIDGAEVTVRVAEIVAVSFLSDAALQTTKARQANEALS